MDTGPSGIHIYPSLTNGRRHDPLLLVKQNIHLAGQTLSAPEHIAYAKSVKNRLTFHELVSPLAKDFWEYQR